MTTQLVPFGDNSTTILKKPVIGISEDDKNLLKVAVEKWAKNAKSLKIHKPIELIAERDKLLIEWLFNTGMRISDALLVKFRDINPQNEDVTFLIKKRSKVKPFIHTISLDKSLLFEVNRFKERFLFKPDERLFQISRSTFDDNLAKYCTIVGLRKYSAHKFRHGCAMKDLAAGLPDFVTAFRLGHSSTSVTNSTYRRMSVNIERTFRHEKL